jgi:hypothetical protein
MSRMVLSVTRFEPGLGPAGRCPLQPAETQPSQATWQCFSRFRGGGAAVMGPFFSPYLARDLQNSGIDCSALSVAWCQGLLAFAGFEGAVAW